MYPYLSSHCSALFIFENGTVRGSLIKDKHIYLEKFVINEVKSGKFRGPVGPSGPTGRPGVKGDRGMKGESGDILTVKGEKGNQGDDGRRGEPGFKGEPGRTGFLRGLNGRTGSPGIPGNKGEPGTDGLNGESCPTKMCILPPKPTLEYVTKTEMLTPIPTMVTNELIERRSDETGSYTRYNANKKIDDTMISGSGDGTDETVPNSSSDDEINIQIEKTNSEQQTLEKTTTTIIKKIKRKKIPSTQTNFGQAHPSVTRDITAPPLKTTTVPVSNSSPTQITTIASTTVSTTGTITNLESVPKRGDIFGNSQDIVVPPVIMDDDSTDTSIAVFPSDNMSGITDDSPSIPVQPPIVPVHAVKPVYTSSTAPVSLRHTTPLTSTSLPTPAQKLKTTTEFELKQPHVSEAEMETTTYFLFATNEPFDQYSFDISDSDFLNEFDPSKPE